MKILPGVPFRSMVLNYLIIASNDLEDTVKFIYSKSFAVQKNSRTHLERERRAPDEGGTMQDEKSARCKRGI